MPGGAGGLFGDCSDCSTLFSHQPDFWQFPQICQGFGKNTHQERQQPSGNTETAGSSPCISSMAVTPCALPEHLHTLLLSLCVLCAGALTAAGRRCASVGNARVSAFNSCFALFCCAATLVSCLPSVPEALFNTQLGARQPLRQRPPQGRVCVCVPCAGSAPPPPRRPVTERGRGLAGGAGPGAGPGGAPSSCRPPALPTCEDVMSAPHYPNYADLIAGRSQWGRAAVPTC